MVDPENLLLIFEELVAVVECAAVVADSVRDMRDPAGEYSDRFGVAGCAVEFHEGCSFEAQLSVRTDAGHHLPGNCALFRIGAIRENRCENEFDQRWSPESDKLGG